MNEGQEFIKAKIHVNIQKLYIQIKYRLLQNENEIKMLICFVCSIENQHVFAVVVGPQEMLKC